MKYIFLAFALLLPITSVQSEEIKEVRWGTEVWKGYTDEDGSGIFTKVMQKIFESQGIKLNIQTYPIKRALHLTVQGKIDIAGGIPKDIHKSSEYIQAKYPIIITRINAFYHKSTIENWNGMESVKGKKIVSTPNVGGMIGLKANEYSEVTTRKQTLHLVLKKRFELYIDDEKLLASTVDNYKNTFNSNDYMIKTVFTKGWYFISTNNERGQKIMTIFEKGMEQLEKSGELYSLYNSHGFSVPFLAE